MAREWTKRSPLAPAGGDPILMLAPMEGISDAIVRALLSELGGMDLSVTEFIRVSRRALPREVFLRECPELSTGGKTAAGVPVIVQLLGGEVEHVAESARTAAELGALGIDLNFGCPAKRVNGSDGGAALLREPHRITDIVAAVRRAVPREVTVSAKIRLGWEDPDDVVASARAVEDGGADWLTIHGRTRMQQYRPSADWHRIARARAAVQIPVVANGDIFRPEDVALCASITGANAFMLGRGAFRTPNLFRWIRGLDQAPWSFARCVELLEAFAGRALVDPRFDDPPRAALNRVKGWTAALAETDPEIALAFEHVKRTQDIDRALELLRNLAHQVTAPHLSRQGDSTHSGPSRAPAPHLGP